MLWLWILIGAIVCGVVGIAIASEKGRGPDGFAAGFLLGPIGWIVAALLPAREHPTRSAPPPFPTMPSRSITEQIEDLAALRDRGRISIDEFETKKTELLGRI